MKGKKFQTGLFWLLRERETERRRDRERDRDRDRERERGGGGAVRAHSSQPLPTGLVASVANSYCPVRIAKESYKATIGFVEHFLIDRHVSHPYVCTRSTVHKALQTCGHLMALMSSTSCSFCMAMVCPQTFGLNF